MPVSKAFNSVESRMPFKLCAPNAPKIMPKQIKIAPVTTYVLFIAQRCEKPMKLVSLMRYFMKFKFFFFVTLFILFSCSEKNTEKKQSQTKIDYYQFREVNLVSFGIPATLMIPNETAGIGASFEPKIYHDDGGFKWHINVGRHFNIHIEDYGDYQYLMPEFLRRINTKDIFNIDIIEKSGISVTGFSPDGKLVEIVERIDHPWFIGVQFHPELKSTPFNPHPIFNSFIDALIKFKNEKN